MSKQLTRLISCDLNKVTKITTSDGDRTETSMKVGTYSIITQELSDEISANIYGANLNKIRRISSVHNILEILLRSKLNNSQDNISKYRIIFNGEVYKITDVKSKYIDIEYVGSDDNKISW